MLEGPRGNFRSTTTVSIIFRAAVATEDLSPDRYRGFTER